MLKNAYLLAKIGADTAENEQQSAEILPIGLRSAEANGRQPAAGASSFRFNLGWYVADASWGVADRTVPGKEWSE